MWKITVFLNVVLMVLFWIGSLIVLTPAYNHLVQYPEAAMDLPVPTAMAMNLRWIAAIVPLAWAALSIVIYKKCKTRTKKDRNEWNLAFTTATLSVGFAMFLYFLTAGILPFLKIGSLLN